MVKNSKRLSGANDNTERQQQVCNALNAFLNPEDENHKFQPYAQRSVKAKFGWDSETPEKMLERLRFNGIIAPGSGHVKYQSSVGANCDDCFGGPSYYYILFATDEIQIESLQSFNSSSSNKNTSQPAPS